MAANASKMQGIVNGDVVSSTVSSKCSSSYSSPSNFWRSTMPDLQHSRGGSSQLNYGIKSGHNVSNESTLDMSGGDGSDLQSSIIGFQSESDMVSRMFQSSQGTGQESCQNSGAHRVATDQTTTTSSSHRFSYSSGGKNGALKGKRRLRSVEDGECQSEEECTLDGLKKRGCSMTKRSRVAEVHNLSERRRRDRINEKMKILQELIPNCSKADKASILEEAIQYLKLLQLQVQILTMKAMTAYSGVSNLPIYSPTYLPMGMDMGLNMAMGMGMMSMGGTVVHASASDRVIPILRGSPTIAPSSGTVLVSPHGMGMVGMGGTMLSSTIAPTAAAVVSSNSTSTVGTALVGLHDKTMVGMESSMVPPTIAPTSRTIVVSATSAPIAPTLVVNPPGMGMVSMGGTTCRAYTSDRVVPTMRGSSTISPASGTVLDSSQEVYGIGMTSVGTMVHASISDRVVPTLRASSSIPPSSGTVSVSVSPQEDIYVPSLEL